MTAGHRALGAAVGTRHGEAHLGPVSSAPGRWRAEPAAESSRSPGRCGGVGVGWNGMERGWNRDGAGDGRILDEAAHPGRGLRDSAPRLPALLIGAAHPRWTL